MIPEIDYKAIFEKYIRIAIDEMCHEEMEKAIERMRHRLPDVVSGVSIRLSEHIRVDHRGPGTDISIYIKMEDK